VPEEKEEDYAETADWIVHGLNKYAEVYIKSPS